MLSPAHTRIVLKVCVQSDSRADCLPCMNDPLHGEVDRTAAGVSGNSISEVVSRRYRVCGKRAAPVQRAGTGQ